MCADFAAGWALFLNLCCGESSVCNASMPALAAWQWWMQNGTRVAAVLCIKNPSARAAAVWIAVVRVATCEGDWKGVDRGTAWAYMAAHRAGLVRLVLRNPV